MKPTVYIETTIVGYLTSRPFKNPLIASHQGVTRGWWDHDRHAYELVTSEVVRAEASAGDVLAAAERMKVVDTIRLLRITPEAQSLTGRLLSELAIPAKETRDAAHVAIAAVSGVNYLLTWNCRHLANASLRFKIEAVCRSQGFEPPIICTPLELTEVQP